MPSDPRHVLKPFRMYDFSGGLVLARGDLTLAPNELRVLENFDLDAEGALKKRKGLMRYNDAEITGYRDSTG